MSDIPGKAYHMSTNKGGLLTSNLDIDNVPEKEMEQNADINGGALEDLERWAIA